eukprot:g5145.t1
MVQMWNSLTLVVVIIVAIVTGIAFDPPPALTKKVLLRALQKKGLESKTDCDMPVCGFFHGDTNKDFVGKWYKSIGGDPSDIFVSDHLVTGNVGAAKDEGMGSVLKWRIFSLLSSLFGKKPSDVRSATKSYTKKLLKKLPFQKFLFKSDTKDEVKEIDPYLPLKGKNPNVEAVSRALAHILHEPSSQGMERLHFGPMAYHLIAVRSHLSETEKWAKHVAWSSATQTFRDSKVEETKERDLHGDNLSLLLPISNVKVPVDGSMQSSKTLKVTKENPVLRWTYREIDFLLAPVLVNTKWKEENEEKWKSEVDVFRAKLGTMLAARVRSVLKKESKFAEGSELLAKRCEEGVSAVDAIRVLSLLPASQSSDFPVVDTSNFSPLVFPRDHAMHNFLPQEWFYFTGHFNSTTSGKRVAFLSSIVRHAIAPPSSIPESLPFDQNQIYRSSFALTRKTNNTKFHQYFGDVGGFGGSLGVAGASHCEGVFDSVGTPLGTRFQARGFDKGRVRGFTPLSRNQTSVFPLRYYVVDDSTGATIDVILENNGGKKPLLQGPKNNGIISEMPGVSYMYYSYTRISWYGKLVYPDGEIIEVEKGKNEGVGWLDHQGQGSRGAASSLPFSVLRKALCKFDKVTNRLPTRLAWFWIAIQLNDHSEFTGIALKSGKTATVGMKVHLYGSWVTSNPNETPEWESKGTLEILSTWKSPITGVVYPINVLLELHGRKIVMRSIVEDSRMYPSDQGEIMESACDVFEMDRKNSTSFTPIGVGFLESMGWTTLSQLAKQQAEALNIKNFESLVFDSCGIGGSQEK